MGPRWSKDEEMDSLTELGNGPGSLPFGCEEARRGDSVLRTGEAG